jgi:uncharacterized protein (TIGR03663 family)
MNRWSALAALLLAFAAALALRLPHLSARPLHNDEAVNAIKVAELYQHGHYRYDPDEYHGPTLHYFSLPFLWLSKAGNFNKVSDGQLRLVTVFFGAGIILLLPLFFDGLDKRAIAFSALFIAISPAMVFYSRYFIHEILLVFFTVLLLASIWRYHQTRHIEWAIVGGASVGLMYATKETFVITLAAATFAMVGTWLIGRTTRSARATSALEISENQLAQCAQTATNKIPASQFALFAAAALLVWLLFFSSFFTNFAGLADSIRTYLPWLKRAGGHSPHIHPWYFYLERLAWFHPAKGPIWSEALILVLAVIGAIVSFRRKHPLPLFITLYTVALTAAYSIISYKTPWCLLSFYFGMILLAGIGASSCLCAIQSRPLQLLASASVLAFIGQLTFQTWRGNFDPQFLADRRNPYVYAQTVPDLRNLVEKIESLAVTSSAGHDTVIKVISKNGDYWPLPWYLRRFKNIGWYESIPADPYAPIVVVDAKLEAALDEKSDKKWIMVGYTELRPQKFLELYVELDLWKKYVATLPPARD